MNDDEKGVAIADAFPRVRLLRASTAFHGLVRGRWWPIWRFGTSTTGLPTLVRLRPRVMLPGWRFAAELFS